MTQDTPHPWSEAPPPAPGRPRWLAPVVVVAALAAGGAAAVLALTGPGPAATPPAETASATASTTAAPPTTAPAASPTASATASPPATAVPTSTTPPPTATPAPPAGLPGVPLDLTVLAQQVGELRELPWLRPVATLSVTAEELAARLDAIGFTDPGAPEELAARGRTLELLRLVPPGTDLEALLRDLYAEQVLGLYVPDDMALYIRRPGPDPGELTPFQHVTAAHELTHALQDQHWGLQALRDLPDDAIDADAAVLALIEGDGVLLQQRWQQQHQSTADQQAAAAEVAANPSAVLDQAPRALRAGLFFPYVEGVAFVQGLFRDGGLAAVNAAFDSPPETTEQILDPSAYAVDDLPVAALPTGEPGEGWTAGLDEQFGAFDLLTVLAPLGDQRAEATATGWDGGRLRSWERDGTGAVVVALAFDTPEDAAEACAAVPEWYTNAAGGTPAAEPNAWASPTDVLTLACGSDRVTLAIAPDVATARALSG